MRKDPFSQPNVYKRMLQTAAEAWNVRESDLTALDPTYKLLLNALAREVEQVGHELKGAEARILKRLARQLMPHALQSVVPAHSIIHFTPTEKINLSVYDHFQYEKRWQNKDKFNRIETKSVHFTAAAPVQVLPAALAFRVDSSGVYEVEGAQSDALDISTPLRESRSVLLGIRGLKAHKLSLYFDWLKEVEKKGLFQILEKMRVTHLDGTPVNSETGLLVDDHLPIDAIDQLDPTKQVERLVLNYYESRFLTLEASSADAWSQGRASAGSLGKLVSELDPDESCAWLVLHFPEDTPPQMPADMFVQINCFPVINRRMERQVFRLQPEMNIKKLDFEGAFLDVERVESTSGSVYQEVKQVVSELAKPGTFTIRRAHLGRLDSREAAEYLSYALGLIKDEKQAFAALDASSTAADLQKIDQAIKRVQKRITSSGLRNTKPYIMLTPHKESENAYIYFWSTDGSFANGVPRESTVDCKTAGISMNGNAILLSDVIGGEDELSDPQLVQRYRNALLTRGVIVTKADIVSHCRAMGGGVLDAVDVRKEIEASSQSKSGLRHVIHVYVSFRPNAADRTQKNYLLQRLESEIRSRSNFALPLKVMESHD